MDDSTPNRDTNGVAGQSGTLGRTAHPPETRRVWETPDEMLDNYACFRYFAYEKLRDEGVGSAPELPADLIRQTLAHAGATPPGESREEKLANYLLYRPFVYRKLQEEFERTVAPLPDDVDLEAFALAEGGGPIDDILAELEKAAAEDEA